MEELEASEERLNAERRQREELNKAKKKTEQELKLLHEQYEQLKKSRQEAELDTRRWIRFIEMFEFLDATRRLVYGRTGRTKMRT